MKLKREVDLNTSELKIIVGVDTKVWDEYQLKAKQNLVKNLSIPGFRKGKAPLSKVEARISTHEVMEKALNKLLPSVAEEAAKEIQKSDIIIGEASYNVSKISKEELELIVTYPIYPQFELKGYKNSGVKLAEVQVTDEDIKLQTEKMLEKHSALVSVERAIQKGDLITFDFKGYIDNEPFDGGEAEGFELKIGSGHFIPGFEASLIGKTKGFDGEINVTFPQDYHMEQYSGKPAVFKVKIHDVQELDIPQFDEEFVTSLGIKNVTNEEQLKIYLKDLTTREVKESNRTKFQKEVFEKIMAETHFPIPETLVLAEMKKINTKFEDSLKEQEFTRKEYLDLTKFTEEQIGKQIREEALKNLKTSLIYAEVAKVEDLVVSEEEYEKEYQELAKIYGVEDLEQLKKMLPKENLQIPLLNKKVIDKLIEFNN